MAQPERRRLASVAGDAQRAVWIPIDGVRRWFVRVVVVMVEFEMQQMGCVLGFVEDIAHRRVAVEIAGGDLEVALAVGGNREAAVPDGAAAQIEWCDHAPLSRGRRARL